MSATVSIRFKAIKKYSGSLTHDLDNSRRPGYVDSSKTHLNSVVLGNQYHTSKLLVTQQAKSVVYEFNSEKNRQRELLQAKNLSQQQYAKERRKIRNWQANMKTHLAGLIIFGKDANANSLSRAEMDQCAIDYVKDFGLRHHVELTYLVRHEDEATVHYHFLTTNFDAQKKQTLRFNRDLLRKEQDYIGLAFSPMGLQRGIDKYLRLEEAAKKLGLDKVDGKYPQEVWRLANVIHRSVKQLHEDLPLELNAKHEQSRELSAQLELQQALLVSREERIQDNENKLRQLKESSAAKQTEIEALQEEILKAEQQAEEARNTINDLALQFSAPRTKTVEVVTTYEKNLVGQSKPVIKESQIVTLEEARKTFEVVAAKERKLAEKRRRLEENAKAYHELIEKEKQQAITFLRNQSSLMKAFFNKQAFKHLIIFGKPFKTTNEIVEFMEWYETAEWENKALKTRFKVQNTESKVVRVVVDNNEASSMQKAEVLIIVAAEQGLNTGAFVGSDSLFVEFWHQNEQKGEQLSIHLSAEQEAMLMKQGLMNDDEASIDMVY